LPSYELDKVPLPNVLIPVAEMSAYPPPHEHYDPPLSVSTLSSTLEKAASTGDIAGQSKNSWKLADCGMNTVVKHQDRLLVFNEHTAGRELTSGQNDTDAALTNSVEAVTQLPGSPTISTPRKDSGAQNASCDAPSSDMSSPIPLVWPDEPPLKRKRKYVILHGKKRKKPRSPDKRSYKCPNTDCIKAYLNPNGLAYHLKKGTCEYSSLQT
jgi:hypothetical protein